MSGKMKVYLMLFVMLCSLQLRAQSVRFTASASGNTANVGDQIEITFELQGAGGNFQAPSFAGFNVLMGPAQSSQMQFINGTVTQSISYTYVIQATKEGTYKIGPAYIDAGGKKVPSNVLTISVLKGGGKSQGGGGSQGAGGGEASLDKSVFLRASVNRSALYRGEGVVVTYKLYTRVNLVSYSLSKLPALEGFYSQELQTPQQPQFHNETLDGVKYSVAEIKKVVLFPQRSGTLTIDPMKGDVIARVQVKQQRQPRNPFDIFNDPFFGGGVQDVKVELKSDPVKITSKELPGGAPASFNGAVGRYSITTSVDKKEAKAHDAITLKIKLSGKGNIKLVDPPAIDFSPDFETYDPKINSNASITEAGASGSKSFEYLMIPRNPGEYKLTVAEFCWFDPEKGRYETQPASEYVLKISKGEGNEAATVVTGGVAKSDIQFIGKDIRFIKTNIPVFTSGAALFYQSPLFYSLLVAPLLLFILLVIFRKRYAEVQGNVTLLKSRKANKVAMKRLSAAKKFLQENNSGKFLDEMFRALWGFVSDKLHIPVADLSRDNVLAALTARGVSPESIALFTEALDACEMARFARGASNSNEEIYRKGIDVISKLEQEMSARKPTSSGSSAMSLFVLFFVIGSSPAFAQDASSLFNEANALYQKQRYDSAATLYTQMIESDYKGAEVYYNLANCYYKTGQNSRAILNYERALKFAPADEDINFNLKVAQLKVVDKIERVPEIFYVRWINAIASMFSTDGWATAITLLVWLSFLCAAIYFVSSAPGMRRLFFILAFVCFLLTACTWLLARQQYNTTMVNRSAVVMSESVYVKSSPGESNTDLFLLHEGTRVSVLDEFESWIKIRIDNGSVGWIKRTDVEEI